jgi:hypothetical protein
VKNSPLVLHVTRGSKELLAGIPLEFSPDSKARESMEEIKDFTSIHLVFSGSAGKFYLLVIAQE